MQGNDSLESVKACINEVLLNRQLVLVDFRQHREGKDLVLRIIADKEFGGISIDECAQASREIGNLIDERGLIKDPYMLEFSSPGLDRPLLNYADFRRCLNKEIKVFLKDKVADKLEHDGIIRSVTDSTVTLETKNGLLEIPLVLVQKAKQRY